MTDTPPSVEAVPGEPTRFLVASDSGEPPYLVDVAANGGACQCGCIHWATRLGPRIEAGERDWSEKQTMLCKHGKRALMVFAREQAAKLDKNL